MWIYEQLTGNLFNGLHDLIGKGYSGAAPHKNDPQAQNIHNQGPIPQGLYTIQAPKDTEDHGPYVLTLVPNGGNEMFGRAGFLIHGDSLDHPGEASEGCIIMSRDVREDIWRSNDEILKVVSGDIQ